MFRGIEILNNCSDVMLTSCGIDNNTGEYCDGPILFDYVRGEENLLKPNEIGNCASTRGLFVKERFFRIGGFHPIVLPHYGSGYEYSIRGSKKEYPVISSDDLTYFLIEKPQG